MASILETLQALLLGAPQPSSNVTGPEYIPARAIQQPRTTGEIRQPSWPDWAANAPARFMGVDYGDPSRTNLLMALAQSILPIPGKAATGPLTRVMAGDKPKQVYHGTQAVFDQFDPQKVRSGNLFGPGFYFTENPEVASGYARTRLAEVGASNVRPAHLDITKPFDLDADIGENLQKRLVAVLEKKYGVGVADYALEQLESRGEMLNLTAGDLYKALAKYGQDDNGRAIGTKAVTQALRELGFDGLTHIGGDRTGGVRHRVWIAFKPEQVINPYQYLQSISPSLVNAAGGK